ncbi:outer membrane beta-barrel protein [Lutibacter maritimus]|uniref:Outer membrane receptor proteins, mostly Fe transport n=1 Tax=Lutibacter maritimus TaxID=593133 RepID=A0A1I6NTY5_9FLAO|nr:outer membrane beta-barrel protein [Lutibacter maritimus]SFS31329.1 Outer membrane receptor proteins, mostly Fe transport [Lutibacter maritimus]
MKKFILLTLSFISLISIAQNPGNQSPQLKNNSAQQYSITGIVLDAETKQPLEYATIVCTPLNGKAITGGITDQNGKFDVQVAKGSYDISVEFISFKTKTFKNREIKEDLNLGTILLEINAESLNEVEIIAEKSTVEIRLDKKIYNVGKDMTVKGGTASDVLDNVPSVSVDVEGNVSLRGSENVRILVNGKPSGLVGLSGTDALRQLPADAIEKVEVITSPSARYDAEGTAGILNIILRKGKALGFNSSFTATAGNPDYFGASANLNYRTNKVNYFTNIGYNYNNSPGKSKSDVTYLNPINDAPKYISENTKYTRENNRFNSQFGVEYYINDKTSLTGTVLYRTSDGDDASTNTRQEFNASKSLLAKNYRLEDETEKDKTLEYTLNLTKDFKKEGHKLTVDFRYGKSNEDNKSNIFEEDDLGIVDENTIERSFTDETSEDVLLKADYVLPINENTQFEFGVNADLNNQTTDYLLEEFENNQYVNNTNFSNTLDFQQNVYSVYSQYGQKINKFSYLFGLRLENTDRTIKLIQTNEDFSENFTELFPTVNLGLEFSESENITLGYSRRLSRPRSFYLNPFETRTSKTYIRSGNIYLDPTYTNSFDFGYLKRWDKITLNSSIYYQHTINNIEWVESETLRDIDNVETLVILRSPINLSSQDRYGFEFTTNYTPLKWWKLTNSFNFFKSSTEGNYNNVSYDKEDTNWFTRLESRITLPGKIDWQTSGMYMGPSEGAFSKRDGIFSVNLAFSKDILNENGTLSLNVSDLLNSRKRTSSSYTNNTISKSEFQWRSRQILLNFTYRFNQNKKRERSRSFDSGGGEEEMFKA